MNHSNFKLGRPTKPRSLSKSRKVLFAILVLILIVFSVTAWIVANKETGSNNDNGAETTTLQIEADKNSQNSDTDTTNLPDNSSSITPEDVPTSASLAIEALDFSQSGGIVNASAKITGTNLEGTCVITFKNPDDRPVIRQINSVKQACSTSISEVEFQKIGTWNLNVIFYQDNTKAEGSRDVTVN